MQRIKAKIKGVTPLMMASPHTTPVTAPEFNYYKACLYLDSQGLYLPGEAFEMALKEARKLSNDPHPNAGVRVLTDRCEMIFNGPHTPEGLFADPRFVDRRPARVDGQPVVLVRPVFPEWATEVEFAIDERRVSEAKLLNYLNDAGFDVGVGAYRQRFGRFEAIIGGVQ